MKNFIAHGSTLQWTNNTGAKIASGAVVTVGALLGVAATDIDDDATGTVQIEGVFELACNAADVIAQGQMLAWDASQKEFVDALTTAALGDNQNGAVAVTAAPATVRTVHAKLLPGNGATT